MNCSLFLKVLVSLNVEIQAGCAIRPGVVRTQWLMSWGLLESSANTFHTVTVMSNLAVAPNPRALVIFALDWSTVSTLAAESRVIRDLEYELVTTCDWKRLDAWHIVRGNIANPSLIQAADIIRLQSQLWAIQEHVSTRAPEQHQTLLAALQRAGYDLNRRVKLPPPELFLSLPTEISDMIIPQVVLDSGTSSKLFISRLSLLSKGWLLRYRPFVFRSLVLRHYRDIQFIVDLARSTLSGWLAPHIERIEIDHAVDCMKAVPLLYSLLPSLQTLHLRSASGELQSTPLGQTLRLGMRRLTALTVFRLTKWTLHSFRTLAVFLEAIPSLEELFLDNITFRAPDSFSPEQFPPCNAPFAQLRRVQAKGIVPSWPLAWLLAVPACAFGHTRRRRTKDRGLPMTDISNMMKIIRLIAHSGRTADKFDSVLDRMHEGVSPLIRLLQTATY